MRLENVVLIAVELLYCAIDIMLFHYCCSLFLEKKTQKPYHIIVYAASVFGVFIVTNDRIFSSLGTFASILVLLVYGFLIFSGKPYRIACSVGLYFIVSGIVTLLMATAVPLFFNTNILIIMSNPIQRAFIVLVTKLIILCVAYLYDRKYRNSTNSLLNIKSMLLFYILAFIILMILFEFSYLNESIPVESLVIIMSLTFILLIVLIVVLTMKYIIAREKSIIVALQLAEANLKNSEYIRVANEQVELLRIKHDLKNHLIVLGEYLRQNRNNTAIEYLNRLAVHPGLKSYVDTHNKVMNAILNHKISEYPNIHFKVRYDDGDYNIETDKLTIILGNALDNAIEAVKTVSDPEIKIVLSENDNYIKIFISNPFDAKPVVHDGMFVSQKNKRFSGMGITNIKNASQSVCGDAIFEVEEDTFKLVVIIDKQFKQ